MQRKSGRQAEAPKDRQPGSEKVQPWLNTKPRANPDTHHDDLKRSIERFEMLLGR